MNNDKLKIILILEGGICCEGRYTKFNCSGIGTCNDKKLLGIHYKTLKEYKDIYTLVTIFKSEQKIIFESDDKLTDIKYHYAYTWKVNSERAQEGLNNFNLIIFFQYLLINYYNGDNKDNKDTEDKDTEDKIIYLFINKFNDEIFEIYLNVLKYLWIEYSITINKLNENTKNYNLKFNKIILKVRFYEKLSHDLFLNMIYQSSSPVFTTYILMLHMKH